eukprot:symbB.v1.2.012574.t1/scaffold873.1/size155814/8
MGTGMMAGGAAGRRVSECVSRSTAAVGQMVSSTVAQGKESRGAPDAGYQFGDLTRGLLSAGRQARGSAAEPSTGSTSSTGGGYRPGDLTRGLFSKLRQ